MILYAFRNKSSYSLPVNVHVSNWDLQSLNNHNVSHVSISMNDNPMMAKSHTNKCHYLIMHIEGLNPNTYINGRISPKTLVRFLPVWALTFPDLSECNTKHRESFFWPCYHISFKEALLYLV